MRWKELDVENREVGEKAPGNHKFRADLDMESCWLGVGPLH